MVRSLAQVEPARSVRSRGRHSPNSGVALPAATAPASETLARKAPAQRFLLRASLAIAAHFLPAASAVAQWDACAIDLNGDGIVGGADLAIVLSSWGSCHSCDGDVNGDQIVDGVDLAFVLTRWSGACAPTVSSSFPIVGPILGDTLVTISGDHLLSPLSVTVGGIRASVVSSSSTSILIATPAGTGDSEIVVSTRGGSASAGTFTYFDVPAIARITPSIGSASGGELLTIDGAGFYGSPVVRFGDRDATSVIVLSPNRLTAVTPPGEFLSVVDVSITTPSGPSRGSAPYRYGVPAWATLLEELPDPSVVTSTYWREALVATGKPWRVRDKGSGIEMLLIPPGGFEMGCTAGSDWYGCAPHSLPAHTVTLTSAFYIGRYEVTGQQWLSNMGFLPPHSEGTLRPVAGVSWLTTQGFLDKTGLRLPTEAEWEYACRAGTFTPFHGGPDFPNGTTNNALLPSIAWGCCEGPMPIGLKASNGLGLHDMIGNVWEWCSDWYGEYSPFPQVDPEGPPSGSSHVMRGGSFFWGPTDICSCGRFGGFNPTVFGTNVGFRVARNP